MGRIDARGVIRVTDLCRGRAAGALTLCLALAGFIGCAPWAEIQSLFQPPSSSNVPHQPTDDAVVRVADVPVDRVLYPYNHAASLVALANGDLLCAWGAGAHELATDTVILLARRPAGAETWHEPVVVADRPGFADANPVLFVDPADRLWLFHVEMYGASFCEGRVVSRMSEDGGWTWSPDRLALDAVCTLVRNKPLVHSDGTWILPAYTEAIYFSQFWISKDQGASWRPGLPLVTLPANNLQPALVERADGSLLAFARSSGLAGFTWQARSFDVGWSWRPSPRFDLPNPDSGLDLLALADGCLALSFNDSRADRAPLTIALSSDEGRTWSRRPIDNGPMQVSYPSLCETPDGLIHVAYSRGLRGIRHVSVNRSWIATGGGPPDAP